MAPRLEYVLTIYARVSNNPLQLGSTKGGAHRGIAAATGGYIRGSGIDMQLVEGGSDWMLVDIATGTGHIDARLHAHSCATGASIIIRYNGIIKTTDRGVREAMQNSPNAKTTEAKDHYFVTTPIFEASSEEHKWVEQNVFVGHGRFVIAKNEPVAVEYEVYKVVSA